MRRGVPIKLDLALLLLIEAESLSILILSIIRFFQRVILMLFFDFKSVSIFGGAT